MQKGVLRKRRPTPPSEYARQLQQKQELKRAYNLRERQFKNYVKKTMLGKEKGDTSEVLIQALETRLDNAVFRMGMAPTRPQARQMVSHGHFRVNGKPAGAPSFRLKKGDVISVRPQSAEKILFKNAKLGLKKYQRPTWIELNRETMEAKIIEKPSLQEAAPGVEVPLVFEFYSR